MRLKRGVKTLGIKPEIMIAIMVADGVYQRYGKELVITSIVDSKHSKFSRHYPGLSFDSRTYYFTYKIKMEVSQAIRSRLGIHYLVLVEKDHLHISYKPTR